MYPFTSGMPYFEEQTGTFGGHAVLPSTEFNGNLTEFYLFRYMVRYNATLKKCDTHLLLIFCLVTYQLSISEQMIENFSNVAYINHLFRST